MQVYIVRGGWKYDGNEIIGIRASMHDALNLANKRIGPNHLHTNYDFVRVELWTEPFCKDDSVVEVPQHIYEWEKNDN